MKSEHAGKPADPKKLVDIPKLITAYFARNGDPKIDSQRIEFGTSGHRGSSLKDSFNENHILAISQAISLYRKSAKISGPLFIGKDTHALSEAALVTAIEVFAANEIEIVLPLNEEYTPTPVISHAILCHNKTKKKQADGVVITPSHNPPQEGGFKYNPPNGGPANLKITKWIEKEANAFLEKGLKGVKRIPYTKAITSSYVKEKNFLKEYVDDLKNCIDMDVIKASGIKLGVDPLGGAGVHYWGPIAEQYGLNLTVVNEIIDPTFRFMTLDWDGQIRMDPSSPFAMQPLIKLKNQYDISFGCDTDHDRHGIVTKTGLMPSNSYLSAAIYYLFTNRPQWKKKGGIGKTMVSTQLIDRIASVLNRPLFEMPVGFKWFVDGLLEGSLNFGGEESAGATFSRLDGSPWTTDKDGIVLSLLAAEITAKLHKDPSQLYQEITTKLGKPYFTRVDGPISPEQKKRLKTLSPESIPLKTLAGEKIVAIQNKAPANGEPLGGIKVVTKSGWFAARPSGTENIYKIYAESFLSEKHLVDLVKEAKGVVGT